MNLFLNDKISVAIERIKEFIPKEGGYYLAFSGGKDSQVIHKLTEMSGVPFDAHYNITTVDPPELIRFIKDKYPNVAFDKPEKTMWQLIPKHLMPPTRIVRYCCDELKERGGNGRSVMTGVRAEESNNRARRAATIRPCKRRHGWIVNPIIDWSESDVWEFIEMQIGFWCELYDRGWKRIGCIGCPMSNEREKHFREYPKIRRSYILAFERMISERLRQNKPYEWTTGEQVMDWWLSDARRIPIDEKQKNFVFEP